MEKVVTFLLIVLGGGLISVSPAYSQEYSSGEMRYRAVLVAGDLDVPWGMAWLPDGSMLVTERDGRLLQIKGDSRTEVTGLPEIYSSGQGGLMEVVLHPDHTENGWIYLTYSFREGGSGGNTALIRGRLEGNSLVDIQELFRSTPNARTRHHYGGRIAFDKENFLFLGVGERGTRENAQDKSVSAGSIIRLHDDGEIPEDNPFAGEEDVHPAIWSYGHRNPQGIAFHPETSSLFNTEHGPQGGDELNLILPGRNYGWPVITFGKNYDGTVITDETSRVGMEQPVHYWVPSIAPGSLMFVTSDRYPDWKGDALVGSLKFNYVERVIMQGDRAEGTEKLLEDIGRVRDVREGPDGYIYVAVEGDGIYRIEIIE